MTRRIVVGREEIASGMDRLWYKAATGDTRLHRPKDLGKGRFWCVADAPLDDPPHLETRAVYRTKVPAGAECEECGISLRDLAVAVSPAPSPPATQAKSML